MSRMVMAPIVTQTFGTGSGGDDVFELTAGSANKIRLHGFEIYSNQTTAEAVTLRLLRRAGAGSGGTAATEVKLDEEDGTISTAMVVNVTTPGSAGDVLAHYEWEQLGPLVHMPTPLMQIEVQESGVLCLELVDNLAASQVWQGWVLWEEL